MDSQAIYCNVYDMTNHNKYTYPIGFGVFHGAIEIYGREYSYGGHDFDSSGIFCVPPKTELPGTKLRASIKIGTTNLTRRQVEMIILEFGTNYTGKTYNIISKNCNHFGDEFAKRLCGKGIPGWINRLAFVGSFFSCVLPIPADEFGPIPVQPNRNGFGNGNGNGNGMSTTGIIGKGRRFSE